METSAPLINAIVSNDQLLHSNSRTKQMPPRTIHILRFCGRLNCCPRFCNVCNGVNSWPGCSVARSLEVLRVSYIIALSDWRNKWCAECQRRHSSRKR